MLAFYNKPLNFSFKSTIACLLFFMMLVFPYLFMGIKIILIILILALFLKSLINVEIKNTLLTKRYTYWLLLYLLMNLLYLLYGILKGNPGTNYYWTIYIFWPIIYILYWITIDIKLLKSLFKVFYIAYISIIIIGIIAFLQINNYLPSIVNIETLGFNAGMRPLFAFNVIQGGCIVSFIFLFPFYLTIYITKEKFSKSLFNTLILVLSFIFIFATSRRALILSIFYLPFIIFFFCRMLKIEQRRLFLNHYGNKIFIVFGLPVLLIFIFSIYLGLFDTGMFNDFIMSAFSDTVQNSSDERSTQAVALIQGWAHSPFFGLGPGIDATVSRSNIPGFYELSYAALLFSRGLFGFSIYFIQIILLIIWGIRLSNKSSEMTPYMISYNVAFVSFMISNATNPYLDAYDHLWVIFLFICLQNTIFKIRYDQRKSLLTN